MSNPILTQGETRSIIIDTTFASVGSNNTGGSHITGIYTRGAGGGGGGWDGHIISSGDPIGTQAVWVVDDTTGYQIGTDNISFDWGVALSSSGAGPTITLSVTVPIGTDTSPNCCAYFQYTGNQYYYAVFDVRGNIFTPSTRRMATIY